MKTASIYITATITFLSLACTKAQPMCTEAPSGIWMVDELASPDDAIIRQRLAMKLEKIDFDKIEFVQVVQFYRDVTGTNIVLDWDALTQAGADDHTDMTITMSLHNATFGDSLKCVLAKLKLSSPVVYYVEGGAIQITTKEKFDKEAAIHTITRVYDISDFAFHKPISKEDWDHVVTKLRQELQKPGSTPAMYGMPSDWFGALRYYYQSQSLGELQGLIKSYIEPMSWTPTGEVGAITIYDGKLIVRHLPEVHDKIAVLLAALHGQTARADLPPSEVQPVILPRRVQPPTSRPGSAATSRPASNPSVNSD